MKKTLLSCIVALAACLASASAFASPHSTASPPGSRAELSKVAKDVSPITVADTGTGAESAYKAWASQRQAQTAPTSAQVQPQMLIKRLTVASHGGGSGGVQRMCWEPGDGDGQAEILSVLLQPLSPHPRK